ncbi:MAG: hypothetical protein ACRDHP_03800, partial [Ktedonobacterales bacterium]
MTNDDLNMSGEAKESVVTLEWRGRDIALVPPPTLLAHDDAAIFAALFAPADAALAPALLKRDRRG